MEVRCDQCQARYRVDDARVGPKGLAMRCGKCGNTFRLARDGTISKPQASKAGEPHGHSEIPLTPTPQAMTPLSTKPVAPPAKSAAERAGGGTVVFQRAEPEPARETPPAAAPSPKEDRAPRPGPAQTPAAPAPPPATQSALTPVSSPPATAPKPEPSAAPRLATPPPPVTPGRPPRSMPLGPESAPRAGPPRMLVLGSFVVIGGLLLAALGFVGWKKFRSRAPPPAAVEALDRARKAAQVDSLTALADAESQATAAIDAAPSQLPAAYAQLAEIEVAWADALNDEAYFWSERAERASRAGDEPAKQDADGKASARQDQARQRLRQAFEAAVAGTRLDSRSKESAVALADYYRAAKSRTNLNLELKKAADLGADPALVAFVQGADLLVQDDAALVAQAIEKLKSAVALGPSSARSRFRLGMAYLFAQRTGEAQKELEETLRLSPSHERAKLALETLAGRPETRDGKRR